MLTEGFGDIHPRNEYETIVNLIVIVVSFGLFGCFAGTFQVRLSYCNGRGALQSDLYYEVNKGQSSYLIHYNDNQALIANEEYRATLFELRLEVLRRFSGVANLSTDTKNRIQEHYAIIYQRQNDATEEEILNQLPTSLMTELRVFLHRGVVEAVPIFRGENSDFLREVAAILQLQVFVPNDIIVREGAFLESMFMVHIGSVFVYSNNRKSEVIFTTML